MLTWISRSCGKAGMDIKISWEGWHGYEGRVRRLAWISRSRLKAGMDIKAVWEGWHSVMDYFLLK